MGILDHFAATEYRRSLSRAGVFSGSGFVHEYKQNNPTASREDLLKKIGENRTAIRQRLVNFLTPEQLTKWDAEVSKAREFLGQKMAA